MDNFARCKYDEEIDCKVKEELQIANISVFTLPYYMNTEVKTKYIGILNGFVFYRAWSYWICHGDMPLDTANEIYKKYKELNIRAGGHCGNEPPITQSYNPIYKKEMEEYSKKVGIEEFIRTYKDVIHDDETQPRFVGTYHIDTQLGLCKLAETIINKNVTCEMKNLE